MSKYRVAGCKCYSRLLSVKRLYCAPRTTAGKPKLVRILPVPVRTKNYGGEKSQNSFFGCFSSHFQWNHRLKCDVCHSVGWLSNNGKTRKRMPQMISKMLPWKTTVSLQEAKNKHVFEKQIHLDCKQGPKALWKSSPLDSGAHTQQLPFCSVHPTVRYRHFVGFKDK